jgi:hypothetical protein
VRTSCPAAVVGICCWHRCIPSLQFSAWLHWWGGKVMREMLEKGVFFFPSADPHCRHSSPIQLYCTLWILVTTSTHINPIPSP